MHMRLTLLTLTMALTASLGTADAFEPAMATYLGGPDTLEEWTAVDVAPDGHVVVAGSAAEARFPSVKEQWLLAGGYGVVARFTPSNTVASVARLGDWIEDLEVADDGRIAVCGSFGVAMLNATGSGLAWHDGTVLRGTRAAQFRNQTPPFRNRLYTRRVARVAAGADGTVASIQAEEKAWGSAPKKGRLYVWDPTGERLCDLPLTAYKYLKDVCVDSVNELVIVGGFNTYAADSRHMKNHPIHMPFLTAYTYTGERVWAAYDFPAAASYAQNTFADSRVQRLSIGRDGMLYMGGYIHGGDYLWRHDPFDVTKRISIDVPSDNWGRASNMGRGIDHGYFAKFNPATGSILQGQVLLARRQPNGGGKPAQLQIKGIHADTNGTVYLAGFCEAYIRDRDNQVVAGQPVGPYHEPEPFLAVVSSNFTDRPVWTVFSATNTHAAAWGVSVRNGRAALLGEAYGGALITTTNALHAEPHGATDGYLVTWDVE